MTHTACLFPTVKFLAKLRVTRANGGDDLPWASHERQSMKTSVNAAAASSQTEGGEKPFDRAKLALAQETGTVELLPPYAQVFGAVALAWSFFQLWIASPLPFVFDFGVISGVPARGIHLAFALALCFLGFGAVLKPGPRRPSSLDLLFAASGGLVASYVCWNYAGLSTRAGVMLEHTIVGVTIPTEVILAVIGIGLVLEATRRVIGLPLVIMALAFLAYSVFGQAMPDLLAHKGVSVPRLAGYQWLTGEAIFGIPIDVSTRFIFLFVLFGAILERAGAGQYFIDLAFALVGKQPGGPAKAAVLASGMTGMISGSSIANTVTTGTFTIPVMKKAGLPATKAGAFEVAASVNGQLMPPIMGAAAFVIAEFVGISYFDVMMHAIVPALISYIALFYITDLEARRLALEPMAVGDTQRLGGIFWRGAHYLLPIALLVYLLMVERQSAGAAVFWAIAALMGIVVIQEMVRGGRTDHGYIKGFGAGLVAVIDGLIIGARNMVVVAIAVGAAGVIVGAVASTGLSNALSGVVEATAGGNVYLLLVLVAVLCVVLGMGLPTTANYLVVASLMAPVIVEVGREQGLMLPLIAVHLFVFYFGLMADVTPPVGLASYAAAGISRANPLATGIQAFVYSIRTAILPFIFVFNLDLLLIGLEPGWLGWLQAAIVFVVSLIAILAFTSLTFRWMLTRLNIAEMVLLAFACIALFRPNVILDRIIPPYQEVQLSAFETGVLASQVRVHVERTGQHGKRSKLFVFDQAPEGKMANAPISPISLGIAVKLGANDTLTIADPGFMSPGERAGLMIDDQITKIDRKVAQRPPKEIIFIPALLTLLLVVLWQRRRAGLTPPPPTKQLTAPQGATS